MAQQQLGDNVDLQFLPDGSVLFVTTDEPESAESYEFLAAITAVSGSVCWGDDNPDEENTRDFTGNITAGSGYTITGSGDAERVQFDVGGYFELETWNFGNKLCKLRKDKYETGYGTIVIKYKDGDTESNCDADSWNTYTNQFTCSNWVKIRVEESS